MNKSNKPVTLSYLANILNLHVTTVSRVLNGNEEDARTAASKETIERIKDLAQKLNYRPNLHAIGLRTYKSRSVGVLIPRVSDLTVSTIYEGIEAAAGDHGYLSFVSNTGDSIERQRELALMALDRGVEGIIFGDARLDNTEFIDELAQRGYPFLLVSRHAGSYCAVTCDDWLGGKLAAEHLISLGHEEFAILAGEKYASSGYDRSQGFIETCLKQGIKIPKNRIIYGPFKADTGYKLGLKLLKLKKQPTAIFAVSDFLAIGLMGAVRESGYIVGKDISIIGYNNTPIAPHLPISLSSINSPRHQMGYRSFELLLDKISGNNPDSEMLAPELIVRDSTGPLM